MYVTSDMLHGFKFNKIKIGSNYGFYYRHKNTINVIRKVQ